MTRTPLDSGQRALAVGLVLSVTLVAFETTAVLTALPTITDELDGLPLYGATIAAYMLADLVALVWAGEWADRYGVRRPFIVCIAMFVSGLIVAGSANSMMLVLVGRLLQGAGSGGFAPLSYTAVRRAFPEDRQGMMYAYLSAGWVLPSLLAPVIGGIVTDRFGWRWVFIGIIPLALLVALLTARAMARMAIPDHGAVHRQTRLPRAIQAAAGVGLVAAGLSSDSVVLAVVASITGVALGGTGPAGTAPAGGVPRQPRIGSDRCRALPRYRDLSRCRQLHPARCRSCARRPTNRAGPRHRWSVARMDSRPGHRRAPRQHGLHRDAPYASASRCSSSGSCAWPPSCRRIGRCN